MVLTPWLIVTLVLLVQPMVFLLWAYLLGRLLVWYSVNSVSSAIDDRVNNVLEQVND